MWKHFKFLLVLAVRIVSSTVLFLGFSPNSTQRISSNKAVAESVISNRDIRLAREIGKAIVQACLRSNTRSPVVREKCAEKLADLSLLRNHVSVELVC